MVAWYYFLFIEFSNIISIDKKFKSGSATYNFWKRRYKELPISSNKQKY